MKIIHFYPNFDNVGGAQSMVFTLFEGMKSKNHAVKICGFTPYDKIHTRYKKKISKEEYIQFSFLMIRSFNKSTLLSHHRKITTYLKLFSKMFFIKNYIIHIAHNEFFNLKRLTLFPKKIIAVSNRVKQNLITEFNVADNHIKVIYNGIEDDMKPSHVKTLNKPIQIVYPARINAVKKQLDLVKQIQNNKLEGVAFNFCGDGELLPDLKKLVGVDKRFDVKGMVDDMHVEYNKGHFTMLFTEREGLPVSLIESCKYGLPIICNDVGGNLEIVKDGFNGYVVNTYTDLLKILKSLQNLSQKDYSELCYNSKKVFLEKFTQEKMIVNYLNYIS